MWAKRVALSGSVGTQGGSLPAARVGGRTPSHCGLSVRPDCACKGKNSAVLLCAAVIYSGKYVYVSAFCDGTGEMIRPVATKEWRCPSGPDLICESSVGAEGGRKEKERVNERVGATTVARREKRMARCSAPRARSVKETFYRDLLALS